MRTDFHEQLASQVSKGAYAFGEFHRLPRVTTPVVAVEFHTSPDRGTGAVAHQHPLRCVVVEPVGVGLELVEDRIQQRGVERVTGLQPVAPDAVGAQSRHRLLQVLHRPRQHGVGAVVGRHRQAGELVGQRLDTLRRGERGHHPAACGQAAEQPAALGHQFRAVLQAEHTRDAGRGVLADAVPQHHIRLETPRLP